MHRVYFSWNCYTKTTDELTTFVHSNLDLPLYKISYLKFYKDTELTSITFFKYDFPELAKPDNNLYWPLVR